MVDRPGDASGDENQALLMADPQRHEDGDGQGPLDLTTGATHPDAPLGGDGTLEVEVDSGPPTPRFVQDEHAWKRWKWVPYPVRRFIKAFVKWSHGPPNAHPYRIKPLLPVVQEYPLFLVDRFLPRRKHRFWLLFLYFSLWLVTFVLVKRQGTIVSEVAGWGQPQAIGCSAAYWGTDNTCGLDGNACRPFADSGFAFRCPANCEALHVLNPHAVGDQEIVYRSLVVGGPYDDVHPENATYRGDSYICAAAIHAGVISNQNGGCGVVQLVGRRQGYVSTQRNAITSVAFDSYFPLSFQFLPAIDCAAEDTRWSLLALSVVFTAVLSIFTAEPALFFFPSFVAIFWTVGMALDTPPHKSVSALFSNILGKFLPAMFVAWVMYDKMGIRRTLGGLTAQFEKTILWLGACWVGALTNYTLDFIPIQRLTAHDLNQQPGAKAALSIIIVILVVIVATQIWFFRMEGRFIKYMKLYALFALAIIIALVLPTLHLRIHHYIMALLLLPGTSLQMRPSLLYQGLLVGLFINGIARWGFDPVLQTSAALQGDAQKGTLLPTLGEPVIRLANGTDGASNITFTWGVPTGKRYDGISILVNDVERFRSYFGDENEETKFTWPRNSTLDLPEYFRFALMSGSDSGDYTKAGIWAADGAWKQMEPGPSKIKVRSLGRRKERLRRE
ncbi:LCCL domain containing protein [Drechmeria coniospora]|uniref:LCCL domain containing protein n=1 Tax=Drechmeria coniospora TaxID=98403 RepID=A0A151GI36_DRECN|nr:LCCL domain containing protein [Drechmeria coniospora]KYK56785.1 LCCL domain containing protein [Drechmeria coniospora]